MGPDFPKIENLTSDELFTAIRLTISADGERNHKEGHLPCFMFPREKFRYKLFRRMLKTLFFKYIVFNNKDQKGTFGNYTSTAILLLIHIPSILD